MIFIFLFFAGNDFLHRHGFDLSKCKRRHLEGDDVMEKVPMAIWRDSCAAALKFQCSR